MLRPLLVVIWIAVFATGMLEPLELTLGGEGG